MYRLEGHIKHLKSIYFHIYSSSDLENVIFLKYIIKYYNNIYNYLD